MRERDRDRDHERDHERDVESFMTEESRVKEYADEELEDEVYPHYLKPHSKKKETDGVIYGQAKPLQASSHFKLGSPGYWPKWFGRSLRPGGRNEFPTVQLRPGKLSGGKTVAIFTDEAERRIASARMAQNLIARTKNSAFPVYAHRNVNYS